MQEIAEEESRENLFAATLAPSLRMSVLMSMWRRRDDGSFGDVA